MGAASLRETSRYQLETVMTTVTSAFLPGTGSSLLK